MDCLLPLGEGGEGGVCLLMKLGLLAYMYVSGFVEARQMVMYVRN
jgi:hypothetical protein